MFVKKIFRYGTLYFILNKHMMYGRRELNKMEMNEENNLEYYSHPLFRSFNGKNGKSIPLFESLSGRERNG